MRTKVGIQKHFILIHLLFIHAAQSGINLTTSFEALYVVRASGVRFKGDNGAIRRK